VLCSHCATNLPESALFCPKCGQPVSSIPGDAPPILDAILGCSKCGASLPEGAQFCLRCGKPVSSLGKSAATDARPPGAKAASSELPRPRRKRRIIRWILAALFLLLVVWIASSDNPFAQAVQETVGWKHDQPILDSSFSLGPPAFRYYKFALPQGSVNVAVVGQFTTTAGSQLGGSPKEKDGDHNIEVYVLSEAAFTIWQNGYATSSLYDSGRVAQGAIQTDVPAGEGIYYLIFSNKFAPKTAKNVRATVLLRYKSWLPDWFRRMKDRLWNWLGL